MYQDTDLQLPSSSAHPLPNQSFLATQRLLCEKAISLTDNLIPAVENKLSQFSKDITETKYFDKSLGEEIFHYRLTLLKEHIISESEESILQHAAELQMMADTALATLGTLKEKMAAGLPKNKLSLEDQLIELQGIVGKYRLSPRCYEQGLDSLKETLSDNIHHIEIIEKIRKLFQTSLKNQPEFLMECFQNDVFSEFNESSKNNEYFEQVVNYYKPLIKDKVFFKQDNWLKNRYNERTLSQPTAVKKHQATLSLPENLLNTESEKNCYPVTITSQLPWHEPGKWLPTGAQPDPEQWINNVVVRVNRMLALRLPAPSGEAHRLCEAMHYATLGGGKRIRTLLCHAAGMTCGASEVVLDEVSAAIEMVHTSSLVHDDLPALDDDVLRRGRPTTHVQYDEATAILVGDALQAQAFLTLGKTMLPAERRLALIDELAAATGFRGIAGGQALDLQYVGCLISLEQLEQMHRMKTGALISAAIRMGALCGKPDLSENAELYNALHAYSQAIGLAFQVVDDLLDVTSDTKTLGKTAGKDAAASKPTYVSLLGVKACRDQVRRLRHEAHAAIQPLGELGYALRGLINQIMDREA